MGFFLLFFDHFIFFSWIITSDIHGVLYILYMALSQLALAIIKYFDTAYSVLYIFGG